MEREHFLYKEECYNIIGACMNVHNELGCGFLEPIYQEALALEFLDLDIPFEAEKLLLVHYKDHILSKNYIADFVCYDKIILELKTTDSIATEHIAQILNYLKATNHKIGLIVNFGTTKIQYKRIIL